MIDVRTIFVLLCIIFPINTDAAEFPNCILRDLGLHNSPSDSVIYNISKLCLVSEQKIIDASGLQQLQTKTMASLIDVMGQTSLRLLMTNATAYTITNINISLETSYGVINLSTDNFAAVYHGPGFISGIGHDPLLYLTIPPSTTREFDIILPEPLNPLPARVNWSLVEAKGIR